MTSVTPLVSRGLETGCSRDAPSAWLQARSPQAREHPLPCPLVFTGTCSKQVRKYVIFSWECFFSRSIMWKIFQHFSHDEFDHLYWCYLTLCEAFHKTLWYSRWRLKPSFLSLPVRPTWFTWSLRPGSRCSLNPALASKCLLFWWNLFKPESKAEEVQN